MVQTNINYKKKINIVVYYKLSVKSKSYIQHKYIIIRLHLFKSIHISKPEKKNQSNYFDFI